MTINWDALLMASLFFAGMATQKVITAISELNNSLEESKVLLGEEK